MSRRKAWAMKSGVKLWMLSGFCVMLPLLFLAPHSLSQSVSPTVLKKDSQEYRELMVKISRQLGVTCTTCHNTANFADASKREFVVAKDHLKIVQLLIDSGMNGQKGAPKADCYMCHRGVLKPAYKEEFDPLVQKNRRSKTVPAPTPQEEDPE